METDITSDVTIENFAALVSFLPSSFETRTLLGKRMEYVSPQDNEPGTHLNQNDGYLTADRKPPDTTVVQPVMIRLHERHQTSFVKKSAD